MTRVRLRPAHTPERLAEIYAAPHDHTAWADHRIRVAMTIQFVRSVQGAVASAADLSCGDGAILAGIDAGVRVFGDLAPGYQHTGLIEDTITDLAPVELLVCCETLEHLDDPGMVLKHARTRTRTLVCSTPVEAFADTNEQHYWAWSREAVETMLRGAGFTPRVFALLDFRPANGDYAYGLWWCV